jgi:hypothetical protein
VSRTALRHKGVAVLAVCAATALSASCSILTSFDGVGDQPLPGEGGADATAGDGGDASQGPGDGSGGEASADGADATSCQGLQCMQVACADGGTTTLSGTVRDPGKVSPVYDAIVYIPNGTVAPLTQGASCDRCGVAPSGKPLVATLTASDGTFKLTNVPVTTKLPLVIQIGKWRRQVVIPSVTACVDNKIADADLTRLPKDHTEGDIPHIAVTTGMGDAIECLLRKMGVADTEFTNSSGSGRVHIYQGQNAATAGAGTQLATALWSDAALLAKYDMVAEACESVLDMLPAASLKNMADYTAKGGRMLGTHYQYTWVANGPAPLPSAATFMLNPTFPPNPLSVTVDTTFPKGEAFAEWLVVVGASTTKGTLSVTDGRADVVAANAPSSAWLTAANPQLAPYFSFDAPFGADAGAVCGKTAIADFHVESPTGTPVPFPTECVPGSMSANDFAAEFFLFDLSACVEDDTKAPQPPPTQ